MTAPATGTPSSSVTMPVIDCPIGILYAISTVSPAAMFAI